MNLSDIFSKAHARAKRILQSVDGIGKTYARLFREALKYFWECAKASPNAMRTVPNERDLEVGASGDRWK